MKEIPAVVLGSLIIAYLIGELVYEIRSGKLLARGWKVYKTREENPMLFWSSIGLHIVFIFFAIYIFVLVLLKAGR